MAINPRRTLLAVGVLAGVALAATAGFVWSGVYNIGADDAHIKPVYSALETLRERSIEVRADKLHVPADLDDPARIRQGAGNYNAMCTGCHLTPGMAATELSKGLYPAPPNLSVKAVGAAEAFWVIKHGIKASGMPAWGRSMADDYIWNMAAFLQRMPELDAGQYQALVASSDGHSHGGGESGDHAHSVADGKHQDDGASPAQTEHTEPHPHPAGTPAHGDSPKPAKAPSSGDVHLHADGKQHAHDAAPAAKPAPAAAKPTAVDPHAGMDMPATNEASDGHAHQH